MQVVEKAQVQNLYLISNTTYDDGKRHHQCSDVMGSSRPPIYKTKQNKKRLSSPTSNKSSNKPFDILHFDIWGPLCIPFLDGYQYSNHC